MKYRKKPVIVDAFQWTIHEVPEWWRSAENITVNVQTGSAFIPTLEGVHEAKIGDFIIKGIQGELYPCKPDIFDQTYELVED